MCLDVNNLISANSQSTEVVACMQLIRPKSSLVTIIDPRPNHKFLEDLPFIVSFKYENEFLFCFINIRSCKIKDNCIIESN